MNVKTAGDVEIRALEELLNAEPPRCESRHTSPGNDVCSGAVTARKITCRTSLNVCESAKIWNFQALGQNITCVCGRLERHCWKILPI